MKTKEFVKYLLYSYPHKNELSKARLQKMVYLCDWKSAIDFGVQITDIKWIFNQYGPYVPEVIDRITEDPDITIRSTINFFGYPKYVISLKENSSLSFLNQLPTDQKNIADFIVENTKQLNWEKFIELVYGTYPVKVSSKFEALDLVKLAAEFREINK